MNLVLCVSLCHRYLSYRRNYLFIYSHKLKMSFFLFVQDSHFVVEIRYLPIRISQQSCERQVKKIIIVSVISRWHSNPINVEWKRLKFSFLPLPSKDRPMLSTYVASGFIHGSFKLPQQRSKLLAFPT